MKTLSFITVLLATSSIIGCSKQEKIEVNKPRVDLGKDQQVQSLDEQEWPFDQAENVAAITTRQVLENKKPILMVIHYSDDNSWAFLCNTTSKEEDGKVIGMGSALRLDPTLRSIADLPPGWIAEREPVGSVWKKRADPDY